MSAVDGILIDRILGKLNTEITLVVASSKSFTICETIVNAQVVNTWLGNVGITSLADCAKQVVLVSDKEDAYKEMNVPAENLFPIWLWVGAFLFFFWGGVIIALGEDVFDEFLAGAYKINCHMLQASPENNLPLKLAILSYWASTKLGIQYYCFLPYGERLRMVVAWLQQLELERLGKPTRPKAVRSKRSLGKVFGAATATKLNIRFICARAK